MRTECSGTVAVLSRSFTRLLGQSEAPTLATGNMPKNGLHVERIAKPNHEAL